MTEQDLNKLADLVVRKLIKRQEHYDKKFVDMVMNNPELEDAEVGFMPKHIKSNEEIIALHLDRLENLLEKYVREEKYEDAERIKKEINRIKDRYE